MVVERLGGLKMARTSVKTRTTAASRGAVYLAVALLIGPAAAALAKEPSKKAADPYKATASAEARQDAIRSIPFDKLDEEALSEVRSVLSDVAIFRRLPIHVVPCDPEMYLFLVRHPDVVVGAWETLGLSKMRMRQTAPGEFQLVDGAGASGKVKLLYQSFDMHVVLTDGVYDGPLLLKPVRGRSLVVLRTGYVIEPDGRYYITSRLDTFVQVENEGAELLAKTFHPLLGSVADANFLQTSAFLGSLSRTAEENLDGVRRLAANLPRVDPDVRRQFAQISERVARRAAKMPPTDASHQAALAGGLAETERNVQ